MTQANTPRDPFAQRVPYCRAFGKTRVWQEMILAHDFKNVE
jgi:hypothetical protein